MTRLGTRWFKKVEHPADGAPPRERRLYQLTDIGKKLLNAETERMQQLVKLSQQIKSTSIVLNL
jgi:DNA-binding PadR family transcriptional regulator